MHQANLPLPADVRAMNALVALAVLALVLMGLALAWQWALRNPAFDLTRITVRGDTAHVNAATLRANVAPRLAGNFFTMDLSKTRAAFEAVPWVRRASVQRLFPNALAVSLQEHKPVAFWGDDDDSTMLNEQAEVFVANVDEIDEDLPHLTGPTGQAPLVLAMYRALAPELLRTERRPNPRCRRDLRRRPQGSHRGVGRASRQGPRTPGKEWLPIHPPGTNHSRGRSNRRQSQRQAQPLISPCVTTPRISRLGVGLDASATRRRGLGRITAVRPCASSVPHRLPRETRSASRSSR